MYARWASMFPPLQKHPLASVSDAMRTVCKSLTLLKNSKQLQIDDLNL